MTEAVDDGKGRHEGQRADERDTKGLTDHHPFGAVMDANGDEGDGAQCGPSPVEGRGIERMAQIVEGRVGDKKQPHKHVTGHGPVAE